MPSGRNQLFFKVSRFLKSIPTVKETLAAFWFVGCERENKNKTIKILLHHYNFCDTALFLFQRFIYVSRLFLQTDDLFCIIPVHFY